MPMKCKASVRGVVNEDGSQSTSLGHDNWTGNCGRGYDAGFRIPSLSCAVYLGAVGKLPTRWPSFRNTDCFVSEALEDRRLLGAAVRLSRSTHCVVLAGHCEHRWQLGRASTSC